MKAIIQHLRFPFSILLLPVFLFAMVEIEVKQIQIWHAILLFFILHVLVYPSSNAYNSLQDNDQGSIGLIKKPLPVPKEMRAVTLLFDISAIILSLFINFYTALGVAIYIIISHLYSYRQIRLKKYPVIGFLTVFIFQGFWIYILVQYAVASIPVQQSFPLACCASCLIGAMYPLSQIYQHKQDQQDGVTSMSYLLGYDRTFLFSGLLFIIGTSIFATVQSNEGKQLSVIIFMICQLPIILFFLFWFYKVWRNREEANYKNTMLMNIISAVCMNSCFIILFFYK